MENSTNDAERYPLAKLVEAAARRAKDMRDIRQRMVRQPICRPEDLLPYVQERMWMKFGKIFDVDDENADYIQKLTYYFSGHPEFEDMGKNYSLLRGLLVMGPAGVGKSFALEAFQVNPFQSFALIPCRDICAAFAKEGGVAIQRFGKPIVFNHPDPAYFNQKWVGRLYDDLGTEPLQSNNFGNKVNVMADVLFTNYEKKNIYPLNLFHVTTNDTLPEISTNYGYRIRSRFGESFNQIILKGRDRRLELLTKQKSTKCQP